MRRTKNEARLLGPGLRAVARAMVFVLLALAHTSCGPIPSPAPTPVGTLFFNLPDKLGSSTIDYSIAPWSQTYPSISDSPIAGWASSRHLDDNSFFAAVGSVHGDIKLVAWRAAGNDVEGLLPPTRATLKLSDEKALSRTVAGRAFLAWPDRPEIGKATYIYTFGDTLIIIYPDGDAELTEVALGLPANAPAPTAQ